MNTTHILIVEDEVIVAEDLASKVRRLGYDIAGVVDEGEKAVEMAGRLRPDLILMDIRLNGKMDGIEAAGVIGRIHDLPVIYLTAHSDDDTLARARLTGPFGYILKPFEERELTIQIEMALHKHWAEREVKKSEERFREAFEHAPVGMTINNLDGSFVYVNQAYCRMVGYSREQLLDEVMSFQKLIHPDDLDDNMDALHRLLSGEIPAFFLERRCIRGDGDIIWVRASVSLRRDHAGNPIQIVRLVEDISPRKKAEEDLRQAQKMEAIGRLAGGVAHEFNNMLNVIIGYADILDARLERKSNLNQYVREIQTAARRSAEMARQLLAYSRKQMIRPIVINLNAVIENQKMMLRCLIRENIQIQFNPGSEIWPVRIDPSQIDQILANLMVNARDAITSTGDVMIATENVRIKPTDALPDLSAGEYVRLTFSDTGIGMEKKVLERIFDPYFTTKEVGKGTGLGLATVYGIVKQNNGDILVESEPGRGTTFRIYLPKSRAEAEVEQPVIEVHLSKRNETILIVEDELQVLNLAEIILKDAGYNVLKANSPGDAIRMVQRCQLRIDLLLTDVIMPEMSGGALQSLIEEVQPGIRTLLMSGYAEDDIDRQALRGRSADLLRKPFTAQSLTEKVRDILDRG